MSVHQPNSKNILRVNSPPFEISDKYIILTPETSGKYVTEIQGVSHNLSYGDYSLRVSNPSLSENQVAAVIFTTEAAQVKIDHSSTNGRDALKKALELYQLSAIAWQKSDDANLQARSLIYIGWLALGLENLQTAGSSFTQALALEHKGDLRNAWVRAYLE